MPSRLSGAGKATPSRRVNLHAVGDKQSTSHSLAYPVKISTCEACDIGIPLLPSTDAVMSGFEIAGIILAGIPLVFSGFAEIRRYLRSAEL